LIKIGDFCIIIFFIHSGDASMKRALQIVLLLSTHFLPGNDMDEDSRVEAILTQMTLEEKIDYIGGSDFSIRALPRLNIPEIKMADGPLGVRPGPSVSYPASICLAASWDTELAARVGTTLAKDAQKQGVHILLAPGMNIYRSPLCGRNFEYLGEDPFLASRMTVSLIKGIQSQRVIATAKHFLGNNQEWNRHHVSSDIDERTLRELYLPAFEAAVKEANVGAVMTSYNLVNGVHMSQNGYYNNEILKTEWGFRGILISDWNSTYDGIEAANGGLDVEMPSGVFMNKETLLPAVQKGKVLETTIDDKVRRILRTAMQFGFFDKEPQNSHVISYNHEGLQVALEAARGGIVLLKNSGILPLDKSKIKRLAVIGPQAHRAIPQGGGSSQGTPLFSQSFLEGIAKYVDPSTDIRYCPGVPPLADAVKCNGFRIAAEEGEIGLLGEYFDNTQLEGPQVFTRIDKEINFQWKERSFCPKGPVNDYSVRWTGYFTPTISGDHTFYISGNDELRLYIDEEIVIDSSYNPGTSLQWKTIHLEAAKFYKVRLEYVVGKGSQGIQFGVLPGKNSFLDDAKKSASEADAVILFAGFGADYEGEDWDRSFHLPLAQNELIKTVLSANKNVVVVLTAGGNVDMTSWIDPLPALLHAWYPGENGSQAIAEILFGEVNPSGKLPASFERTWEDNACYASYYDRNNDKRVSYTEGIFLGYRHFDKSGKKPLFPFGHGLSYTSFAYSNLSITPVAEKEATVCVNFDISNTGGLEGAEIAQVYVRETRPRVVRPEKELKGFAKVPLKPGETKSVCITLEPRAFSYYDVENSRWTYDHGDFEILVGRSSEQMELIGKIQL